MKDENPSVLIYKAIVLRPKNYAYKYFKRVKDPNTGEYKCISDDEYECKN